MNEIEIPHELFICPECKTKLTRANQKLTCPLCKKEVLQDGRFLDFSQLTPKLNLKFADYLSNLYIHAGTEQNDINDNWRIHKIIQKIPKKEIGSICLEIGGADGPLTPILEDRYSIVFSIDLSKPFLKRIETKTKKTFCILGDAQFLPLIDNSVDVVVCSEVLEHVLIPTQLLLEIRRILKPDGYCLLSVPNETNGIFPEDIKKNPITSSDAHVNFYSESHLKKLLFRMGFEICEMLKIGAPINLKRLLFLPLIILRNGQVYSHILTTIRPMKNPDIYWQNLEKSLN